MIFRLTSFRLAGEFAAKLQRMVVIGLLVTLFHSLVACTRAQTNCDHVAFEAYKQRWLDASVNHYSYIVTQYRGGAYFFVPFKTEVKGDSLVKFGPFGKTTELMRTDDYEKLATVMELFAFIEANCKEGTRLEVKYDDHYGFPQEIKLYPKVAANEGPFVTEITEFRPMP